MMTEESPGSEGEGGGGGRSCHNPSHHHHNQNHNQNQNHPSNPVSCRSCKGFLYHTSRRRASSKNPLCFGLSHREDRFSKFSSEQDPAKEARALLDFKYACMGYSVHRDMNAAGARTHPEGQAEVPFCVGLELLVERRETIASHGHMDANNGQTNREGGAPILPRPPSSLRQPNQVGSVGSEDFSSRFLRSAGLVAAAVGNNLSRIARAVKSEVDDIFYPERRRSR